MFTVRFFSFSYMLKLLHNNILAKRKKKKQEDMKTKSGSRVRREEQIKIIAKILA